MVRRQIEGDRDLEEFIAKVANSFVKIELIKFFYHNPHFLGGGQDLSLAIGRDLKRVSKGINDLVVHGVIQKSGQKSAAIWSYQPDKTMHKKISRFVQSYEETDLRQWIVNQVIRRGG